MENKWKSQEKLDTKTVQIFWMVQKSPRSAIQIVNSPHICIWCVYVWEIRFVGLFRAFEAIWKYEWQQAEKEMREILTPRGGKKRANARCEILTVVWCSIKWNSVWFEGAFVHRCFLFGSSIAKHRHRHIDFVASEMEQQKEAGKKNSHSKLLSDRSRKNTMRKCF